MRAGRLLAYNFLIGDILPAGRAPLMIHWQDWNAACTRVPAHTGSSKHGCACARQDPNSWSFHAAVLQPREASSRLKQRDALAACTPLVRAGSMRPLDAGQGSYGGPERAAEQTPHFNPAQDGARSHSMQREASLQLQRSALLSCLCRKPGQRDLFLRRARRTI